jgi:signal transduction histidine kinase
MHFQMKNILNHNNYHTSKYFFIYELDTGMVEPRKCVSL